MAKAKNTDKLVVQNAAKTLLANIRFASVDDPIRTITVTSSIPNEGKSTVSINLAQAIATSGKSVLLVEADMRRRSLSDMLGVRSRGGLYAVLSEQISIDQAIVETGQKNFYFLDAEPHIPNPADIIVSHRFAKLVKALSAKFQYVIFDAPPVGAFIDAAEIASLTDGTLYRDHGSEECKRFWLHRPAWQPRASPSSHRDRRRRRLHPARYGNECHA